MRLKLAPVLTLTALFALSPLAGCNDDDTAGKGGGQISGDAKNVGGEDAREQVGAGKDQNATGGTTPG